jgi:hypothetical protein
MISASTFGAGFGGATQYLPISGRAALSWVSSEFTPTAGYTSWSCPGTFRNLAIHIPTARAFPTVWTLVINGLATALTVTIATGDTDGTDSTHSVTITAGDSVSLKLAGTNIGNPGYNASFCVEFEGDNANESGYAQSMLSGSVTNGDGFKGGAFGNGIPQGPSNPLTSTNSSYYSIVPCDGTITRLDMITLLSGAPGAGIWTAALWKNGVKQDGSGGTVNTSTAITGVATAAHSTFVLTVAPEDIVEISIIRTGANAAFALSHVTASIAFTADDDGRFVICGGFNPASDAVNPTYWWTNGTQLELVEADVEVPVGPTGYYLQGFYVKHDGAPGTGKGYEHMLRQDQADTALVVTLTNAQTTGNIIGNVLMNGGSLTEIKLTPTGSPNNVPFHWAFFGLVSGAPIPPVPTGATFLTRRVRRFPHVSDKQNWLFWDRLQIDIQSGVGLTSGQGSDPQIMLRYSDDGGQTWSHERWQSAGAQGKYRKRAIWKRLGRSRDRVFELVVTDPVKWVFLQALALIRQGRS